MVRGLRVQLGERAGRYRRSARIHLLLTVASLCACLAIFAGANALSKYLFSSRVKLEADAKLEEAKAELVSAVADLAPPTAEIIRSLPPHLQGVLERLVGALLPSQHSGSLSSFVGPPGPPAVVSPGAAPSTSMDVLYPVPRTRAGTPLGRTSRSSQDLADARHLGEVIALRREIVDALEEHASSIAQFVASRDEQDVRREVAETESEARVRIAEAEAEARIDIARTQADATADAASEETERVLAWTDLASSSMTRIGALVLLVWLVRIFNANRQRCEQLAEFYQALADYLSFADIGEPSTLKEMFPYLLPPEARTLGTSPGDDVLALAAQVVRSYGRAPSA